MSMVKFYALKEPLLLPDVRWSGFWIIRHAVERFVERVRPGMEMDAARREMQSLIPAALREKKREPGTWYLMFNYEPPFSVVGIHELRPDAKGGGVRQGFRVITTILGHDCH